MKGVPFFFFGLDLLFCLYIGCSSTIGFAIICTVYVSSSAASAMTHMFVW